MKAGLLAALATILASTPAMATKPCRQMDESRFKYEVFSPSNLVIFARVEDHSENVSSEDHKWTMVRIKHVLYARPGLRAPGSGDMLRIERWQSEDHPRYTFGPGDFVMLFLIDHGSEAMLTQDKWGDCVPALWGANGLDNTAFPKIDFSTGAPPRWIQVDELAQMFKYWEKDLAEESRMMLDQSPQKPDFPWTGGR